MLNCQSEGKRSAFLVTVGLVEYSSLGIWELGFYCVHLIKKRTASTSAPVSCLEIIDNFRNITQFFLIVCLFSAFWWVFRSLKFNFSCQNWILKIQIKSLFIFSALTSFSLRFQNFRISRLLRTTFLFKGLVNVRYAKNSAKICNR